MHKEQKRHRSARFNFLLTLLTLLTFARGTPTQAELQIPTNLTNQQVQQVLSILGPSTLPRLLSNPYPLGGYAGLEVGLSYLMLSTADLSHIGNGTPAQDSFSYPVLSMGKGLYHDVDIFVHAMPYSNSLLLSQFGATVRWCFYEAENLPILLSAAITGNSSNLKNQLVVQNVGYKLTGALYVRHLTLYIETGRSHSSGLALGTANSSSLTLSQQIEEVSVDLSTLAFGATFSFGHLFWSIQLDQGASPIYSTQVGGRW